LSSPGSVVSVARAGTSVLQWVAKKVLLSFDSIWHAQRWVKFHQPRCQNRRLNHQPSKRHRSNAHLPIETNRNQWASSGWHGLNPCPGTLRDESHSCQCPTSWSNLSFSCTGLIMFDQYDPREVRTWMDTMAMTLCHQPVAPDENWQRNIN
jgi:hypothetical protein